MNYQNPKLQHLLAAEYVLGTLQGKARKRFEYLLITHTGLRREVAHWEARLAHLNDIAPVTPPTKVWSRLEKAITPEPKARAHLLLWKSLSTGLLLASLWLSSMLLVPKPISPFTTDYVSIINNPSDEALWIVKIDKASQEIQLEALNIPAIDSNKDYQLWLIPADTGTPESMGLLPRKGLIKTMLSVDSISASTVIAVSLEPKGGSKTGLPTGPVLYQSTLTASTFL